MRRRPPADAIPVEILADDIGNEQNFCGWIGFGVPQSGWDPINRLPTLDWAVYGLGDNGAVLFDDHEVAPVYFGEPI